MRSSFLFPCLLFLLAIEGILPAQDEPLIPDLDKTRKERIGVLKGRFVTPEGFTVEEVGSNDLLGSIVNMTFDARGRPALSREGKGIVLLEDADGDGKFESFKEFTTDVKTAHGMCFIAPGDLIVNANGPEGPGLYRCTDTDGDDKADKITAIGPSDGGIGEHGPHTVLIGPDGFLYLMYGNHSHPDVNLEPDSPLRGTQEDHLLPSYVDPRGHAVHIKAPGGTIQRLDLETNKWSEIVGGFRNAFDMAMNAEGEIFAYDSDMEWDVGLPWYRSTRVVHCIPGADNGWRTGSRNNPFYYIDHLPSIAEPGRGSPVGTAFYYHNAYPERYHGAYFHADWSRGRIRVLFPREKGATYEGASLDFVLGEPLNVTDLDVGPDGSLYFSTGGRGTTGGLYRVRYSGKDAKPKASPASPIQALLDQPMPRSAWGNAMLLGAKKQLGAEWEKGLRSALADSKFNGEERLAALEALQRLGPKPDRALLVKLAGDKDAKVRGGAVFLLGTLPFDQAREPLVAALADSNPMVARHACEALVRSGLSEGAKASPSDPLVTHLFKLIGSDDRFLSYAARLALVRVDRRAWVSLVLSDDISKRPHGALEGLLALVHTQAYLNDSDAIFVKLDEYSRAPMSDETLLDYLRVLDLAMIRDLAPREPGRKALFTDLGGRLLAKFPTKDPRINRELQITVAYMQVPGSVPALLAYLTPDKPQEEQIHTVYALRAIQTGWTEAERKKLVAWFDRGREFGGAASMEGYINNLWQSSLKLMPKEEQEAAEKHKDQMIADRTAKAAALMAKIEGDRPPGGRSDLAQMSFQEISEYLEYDIMTYEKGNPARGEKVFMRSKCVNCHVFGKIGKGGGPDLSTVVKRFRRKEILEAILYPSKVISDQYQAFNVDLKGGDTQSGMLAGENDDTLTLIDATGQRIEIKKSDIKERRPSTVSIMPEGLLDTMNLQDLVDLILFLEKGSE